MIAHLLYPLQQLRRLEANVEPVGRLAAQLHCLQLPEPGRSLHFAIHRSSARFPPEGQGHAKMSIGPHLAATQPHSTPESLLIRGCTRVPRTCTRYYYRGVTTSCPKHQRVRTIVASKREDEKAVQPACAAGVATLTDPPTVLQLRMFAPISTFFIYTQTCFPPFFRN